MELFDAQWQESSQAGLSQPDTSVYPAVGSEPLVRVINLCNGPIRLQFRRLMTARCVTARAGPSAGRVVAFMYGDERKQAWLSVSGWKYLLKKGRDRFHLSFEKDAHYRNDRSISVFDFSRGLQRTAWTLHGVAEIPWDTLFKGLSLTLPEKFPSEFQYDSNILCFGVTLWNRMCRIQKYDCKQATR